MQATAKTSVPRNVPETARQSDGEPALERIPPDGRKQATLAVQSCRECRHSAESLLMLLGN